MNAAARIQRALGEVKGFKSVVLRREQTVGSHGSFVAHGRSLILIKSIHPA
jgi:hypothetical protein